MVASVDVLFGSLVLVGLVVCGLGIYVYTRWSQLGTAALAAFVGVYGIGAIGSGVAGILGEVSPPELEMAIWTQIAFLLWGLSALPWVVFALEYTGRFTTIRWRHVGLIAIPYVIIPLVIGLELLDIGGMTLVSFIVTLLMIYCLVLAFAGGFLLVLSGRSYIHLNLAECLALAATPVILFIAINSVGMFQATSARAAVGVYTAGVLIGTVTLGLPLVRGRILDHTPAVETIGERTIASETDDLVFLVDADDCIVRCNKTAIDEELQDTPVVGEPVSAVLDHDLAVLGRVESVTLETDDGSRRYDPQVSRITDGTGTRIGAAIGLRDVTNRELREERLAVLNRVLRHNLRNQVDVIKSHAEVLAGGDVSQTDQDENGHLEQVVDAAETIADLGRSARTIDQFVSETREDTEIDLVVAIEHARDTVGDVNPDVTVDCNLPKSAMVSTNQRALGGALESAIENAIQYAASRVEISLQEHGDGFLVRITDDGPGIPDNELDSLDSGVETPLQHGTGLGLWQLKWAVRTMNGELTFDTSEGTTVTFTVPNRGRAERE